MTAANKINLVCLLVCLTGMLTVLSITGIPGCRGGEKAPAEGAPKSEARNVPFFQRQEFRDELVRKHRERIENVVIPYNEVRVKLEALIDRARAALPEGANEEQIKIELDGNPEKYPEWPKLYAQATELAERDRKTRTEAFAELGRRLRAEQKGGK